MQQTKTRSDYNATSFFSANADLAKFDVLKTLDVLGVKYKIRPGMDVWMNCPHPQHEEKSPSCHISANIYSNMYGIWHCFGCRRSGTIKDIISYRDGTYVENTPVEIAKNQNAVVKKINLVSPTLPKEFETWNNERKWKPQYLKYLYGRDITWEQILLHGIGYCDSGRYANRVIIPVKLHGQLQTWIGRTVINSYLRVTSCMGGKPGLFGSEIASPKLGPAILCEGWASALAVERLGFFNVMSLQTTAIHPEQFEFLKTFRRIVLIPDGDNGGRRLAESMEIYARNIDIMVASLPEGLDPADTPPGILKRRIYDAKQWRPSSDGREFDFVY